MIPEKRGIFEDEKFFRLIKKWTAENIYKALKRPNAAIYRKADVKDKVWDETLAPFFSKVGEIYAWFEAPEKEISYEDQGTFATFNAVIKIPRLEIERIQYILKDGDLIVLIDPEVAYMKFFKKGKLSKFMITHKVWYEGIYFDNVQYWTLLSANLTQYSPNADILKSIAGEYYESKEPHL